MVQSDDRVIRSRERNTTATSSRLVKLRPNQEEDSKVQSNDSSFSKKASEEENLET